MRKFYLFLFLLGLTSLTLAQTYLIEDFNANQMPPEDWSIDNLSDQWSISTTSNAGGSSPEGMFTWIQQTSISRLISPEIDLSGLTSIMFQFNHFYDDYSGAGPAVGVATRSGGGDWTSVWEINPTSNVGPELINFEITNSDIGQIDFQLCFYVDGNMYNLDYWYIDDIWLFIQLGTDCGISAITTPSYVSGPAEVEGIIRNFGANQINSAELSWQVDEGMVYNTSLTGLSLDFLETYEFSFEDLFNFPIGEYNLKVWLNSVNGSADEDPSNDELMKMISVVSHSIIKTPCLEEFTSSTCGPCASFHTTFVPWCEQHADEMTLVKYQMNWPGVGDPYYTEEGGARRNYYGVSWVPWLVGEGQFVNTTTSDAQAVLDAAAQTPGLLDISSSYTLDGTVMTINTSVLPFASFSNFRIHMVVFEYLTTENVSSNGETEFEHVMMKMVPDANGTTVDLTDRVTHTITETVDLAGTNVEEWDDLGVVVIVQDYASKDVYQSEYSVENGEFATDAMLSDLTVDGVTIEGFSPDIFEYNVSLWWGVVEVPAVGATANDDKATSIIVPATEIPGSTTIDVYAEDLAVHNTYTVNFDYGTGSVENAIEAVSIFPNPTTGKVYINGVSDAQVEVYSITGALVASYSRFSSNYIDLNNLEEGVYFLTVIIENKAVLNKKVSLLK